MDNKKNAWSEDNESDVIGTKGLKWILRKKKKKKKTRKEGYVCARTQAVSQPDTHTGSGK